MIKNNEISKLKKIALLFALSTSLGLSGCGNTDKSSFKDVMYEVSDNTCFDELVGDELINSVCNLESYLDISEKLNKLKLKDNTSADDYDNCNLMCCEDLYILIDSYNNHEYVKESKESLASTLYIQNKLVNAYIRDYGYGIMAEATLLGLKAIIADAAGLSENEAVYFEVMDQNTFEDAMDFIFPEVIIGNYDIAKSKELVELLLSIYEMQSNESAVSREKGNAVYNEDRNNLISKAIENLKKTLGNIFFPDSKNRIKRK